MARESEPKASPDQQAERIAKARLEGLLQVSSSLSQALTPEDVYEIVLEQSVKVLGIRAGGVTVVKEDGSLEIIAAKGQPPGIVEAQQHLPVSADHPVAETVRGGEALYFRSRAERDQHFPHMTHLFSPATRSSAFVPLRSQGKAIGALTLSFPEPHAFDEAEREFMAALADFCARALERARSFEQEQNAKQRYKTLFDSIDEGFCVIEVLFDAADSPFDYRFAEVNAAFERQSGLKGATGKTILELVPGLEPQWINLYGKVARTGESIRFEADVPSMGRFFDIYAFSSEAKNQVGVVFKDVSEQKRSENKLRESEYRLSIASKAAHIGIYDYDVRNNHIYWDDTLRNIWGVTSDEAITYETFAAGLHPDDLARTEAAVNRAFDPAGSGHYYAEYRVIHRQKHETRWVAASGHTFFEDGQAVRLIGTAQDITERKRSEAALREADKRKDEFLATLAHELRNPLAPIRMGLEIMKRTQDTATQLEAQAIIERQTDQLVHLVDDLLDISRITRGKINLYKEHVTLAEIIHLALESARPLLSEGEHQLVLELPMQEVVLEADKTRLCQVFLNLLTNAAKYSEAGGQITLSARLEPEIVQVSVKDTGIGIAPDMLLQVFDLFARVETGEAAKREGLGIGLSLVKQLVHMHGGSVAAFSLGLGHGSEFRVRLPIVREAVRHVDTFSGTKEPGHAARRVLVVDDYEANLKTLSRMLRLMGHEVMTASDGHKALEVLEGFTPDFILLDINMPGLSGYEVAQRIKAKPYRGRLVALTGYGSENDVRKAKEVGFDHHLVKPVEISVLEELLRVSPAA
jgi:PAS domain S-box-containing protein